MLEVVTERVRIVGGMGVIRPAIPWNR